MFKISLGLMCLLIVFPLDLKAQKPVSFHGDNVKASDSFCADGLQEEVGRDEVFARMGPHLFPDGTSEHYFRDVIRTLWDEIPAIRYLLKKLAHKIHYIDGQIKYSNSFYDYDLNHKNSYRGKLIAAILGFIEHLSAATIDIVPRIIGNSFVSEKDADRLTDQIKQVETLVDQLDTISPVESICLCYK